MALSWQKPRLSEQKQDKLENVTSAWSTFIEFFSSPAEVQVWPQLSSNQAYTYSVCEQE